MKELQLIAPIILPQGFMANHPLILQEAVKRLCDRRNCHTLWEEITARMGDVPIPSAITRRTTIRLLIECLARTNIASLMIGCPTPEGIISPSNKSLFSRSGMRDRTGERALTILKAARIVYVHKWPQGKRVKYTKRLDAHLFTLLGFEDETLRRSRGCG